MRHSRLVTALVLIGFANTALADNRFYSYYCTISTIQPEKGLEARVNTVSQWFKSTSSSWFSTTLGPINDKKVVWRKIDDDDTAIGFRYNKSVPSPVLDMTLNAPDMHGEHDFSVPEPVSRRVRGHTVAKRDFYRNDTNYNSVPWNRRTISGSTDISSSCTDNVIVSVVDANGNVGNATGSVSVSYTIPEDAVFPLQVTMTTLNHGNATAVLSDVLGISYAVTFFVGDEKFPGGVLRERRRLEYGPTDRVTLEI
ncbi:hypothetical protein B0H13DRAFT_2305756 [Mycena leptocephala]|nr:hypothetical protein B0H13DRAFT_2305756 [Mycena leptocephala]